MATERTVIDLADHTTRGIGVLAGRDRGKAVRLKLDLAAREARGECFEVVIPDWIYSVNWSFFLGLFGDSIRSLGTGFREQYSFPSEYGQELLEEGMRRATRTASPFDE